MSKPKILCLHGFGTNAKFMQKQAASFMKIISKQVQLIYVDGPFQAPQNFVVDQKVIDMIEGEHRSWTPKIPLTYMQEQFLNELQKIRILFQQAGKNYDGMLGFSQGAGIIHLLLKFQAEGIIKWEILKGIKFAIFLSGSHLKSSLFRNWQKQLEIPSLHLISKQDFVYHKSIITSTQFKNPQVIVHSYGHRFPKLGLSDSKILIKFIRANNSKNQKKLPNIITALMSNL